MDKQETNQGNENNSHVGLLGEYLKQKRVDKNFSLEKLSQKTKISVNILKLLENNEYDRMPSAAYIKGFVTTYVKVLGIPVDEAINKMEYTYLNILGKPFPALNHTKNMIANAPISANAPKVDGEPTPTPHEVIESGDSIIESTKSMLPIIIFGAVILVFIGGYKIISSVVESEVSDKTTKDLGPKIESSAALIHKPEAPKEPVKTETTAATTTTTATTAPAPAAPVAEAKPQEVKPVQEFPRNFPNIDFKKVKSKLFSVKTDAPENSDETLLPKQIKDSMNSSLQNVYIRAVDGNTWMSYKIDNNPIESAIISKGNDLFIQGSEIRIFLGNVNVTKIFYNNYLIESPNKSSVKSLIFPEESNSKYLMPLFPKAKDDILYTAEDYMKRMKIEEEEAAKRKEAE